MVASNINPSLIFDIGMSEGNDSGYHMAKGFNVVGVEADPVVYATLVERFKQQLEDGSINIINKAASNVSGEQITFLHNSVQQGISGTRKHPHVPEGYEEYIVETIRFNDLLEVYGIPYYCKIDIEGNETPFLKDLIGSNALPTYISVECHEFDPVKMLHATGYRKFKLIDQVPPGGFINPNPPREGRYVENPNWHHASGPFGKELPGDTWLNFDEFTVAFGECQPERYRTWFDCHATV